MPRSDMLVSDESSVLSLTPIELAVGVGVARRQVMAD
jgi:hypothetical protein